MCRLKVSSAERRAPKCGAYWRRFSVTEGTIFEDSHAPLTYWLAAIHLMCASKKGINAHQLHRMLGITCKSAWFMAHRIRYAMMELSSISKLTGRVECWKSIGRDSAGLGHRVREAISRQQQKDRRRAASVSG
jgi:hypothetical protein